MNSENLFTDLNDNAHIFIHSAVCNPTYLVEQICETALKKGLNKLNFYHLHIDGEAVHLREKYKHFVEVNCFFVGANCRHAIESGQASYIPVFLSQIYELFINGTINLDYALIQISPFDKHGYATLGPSVDITVSAIHSAKKVIAMINPQVPKVFGDGVIYKSNIDACIEIDQPLPTIELGAPNEVNIAIGKNVANLIENGATLQMGIGDIPNAVLSQLHNHKDLGIHTEMFSDGLIPLVNSGVITNAFKKVHPYRIVSSFAMGSRALYDFIDDNPIVQFMRASYVNDPRVILKNPKVCAINSAIEIDLTGQICSDSIGRKIFSGVGGQIDFLRGAALSVGGKAIIAIPTRTKNGKSKIVHQLAQGAGVVTTRAHAQWVVTEYGAVNLMGKNLKQRAEALISISHPEDRDDLANNLK